MKAIDWFINLIEILLYLSLPIFIGSTLYLISVVKKKNYKIVRNAVTNPVFPNIDLNFFGKLQNEYLKTRKNIIPVLINRLTFYILIIGFILLFILVIIKELSNV